MPKATPLKNIGIFSKPKTEESHATLNEVYNWLSKNNCQVALEPNAAALLNESKVKILEGPEIAEKCDLIIVIGGDGSLLNAARIVTLSGHSTPVVGVNRGGLGFLTDISPIGVTEALQKIIQGEFSVETRFLLEAQLKREGAVINQGIALNDCVLYSGDVARLIEFEVYVDKHFAYSQRSDGLIVNTPTGSTAYALSMGGPILHPSMDAITLVPMAAHTLSSRPIVLGGDSEVRLIIGENNTVYPMLSCDGQVHIACAPKDEIIIKKYAQALQLVHPLDHDYYHTLREKLGWGQRLSNE